MKQVFPQVRPRRLGTRGNSRYCYAGLKKRLKLEEPDTIESTDDKNNIKVTKMKLRNSCYFPPIFQEIISRIVVINMSFFSR